VAAVWKIAADGGSLDSFRKIDLTFSWLASKRNAADIMASAVAAYDFKREKVTTSMFQKLERKENSVPCYH
jgi:hypothetical protein